MGPVVVPASEQGHLQADVSAEKPLLPAQPYKPALAEGLEIHTLSPTPRLRLLLVQGVLGG